MEERPHIVDINVVFPAPLGPRRAIISPSKISKFKLLIATRLFLYIFFKFFRNYYIQNLIPV